MTRFYNKFFVILLILLFGGGKNYVSAQEAVNLNSLEVEEYTNLTLPPLDVLFENAKSAPQYELAVVEEQVQKSLLSKERRYFLSWFSIRGSWQYGTFSNDGYMTSVYQQPTYSYTETDQTLYSVGAAVNIPLDAIFDLGPRVKRQKLNVRAAELRKELQYQDIRRDIIDLYLTSQSQIDVVKLRAEAVVLANIQYAIIEKGFANGTVDSGVLAIEKEKQSLTIERYENSKIQLTKSIMMLEIITNTPILKNRNNQ